MPTRIKLKSTQPANGRIYLAVTWTDWENSDSDSSILVTTIPPPDTVKPEKGLQYYHLWWADKHQDPLRWELHTESGWLGQKRKLGLLLELGEIHHPDPQRLFDPVIREIPLKPEGIRGWNNYRSFIEVFLERLVTLADDTDAKITLSETAKRKLRDESSLVRTLSELLVKYHMEGQLSNAGTDFEDQGEPKYFTGRGMTKMIADE
ncbi:hypothetical protein HD806DRAFT_536778 [Xylariaceae sp. AK1471]|nr:hypothetical protein HD806DRAFT_536778 [Xylariaceae sp. AK1471]